MSDWSQKSDKDTAKNMSDKEAGSPTQPCPTARKIEALFVPPESVDVHAETRVPAEPAVETSHAAAPDSSIEAAHSVVTRDDD